MLPTGHIYGVIKVIQELSFQYNVVLLAVDSPAPHRFDAIPTYKSGRHQPTGDPFEDYRIMSDLLDVLKIATFRGNVFYIKQDGCEADDVIQSLIANSAPVYPYDWNAYFNDNDILQVNGPYHWFRSFHEPEVNRREYILNKYGIDLDFLPVWYKVIHGDDSDKIPNVIPRLAKKKLIQLCVELADVDALDSAVRFLASTEFSDAFKWVKAQAADKESDLYAALKRNHTVVSPRLVPVSDLRFKRLGADLGEVNRLLVFYQIRDFVPAV
jgi:5'-3' exonuclease